MKSRCSLALVLMVPLICGPALLGQTVNPSNPGIFQYFATPVSSQLAFLASQQGGQVLLHSPAPNAKALLTRFHPELVSLYPQKPLLKAPSGTLAPAITVTGCGTASGTQMNLEGPINAVPQNTESIDFLLHRLTGGTGTANTDLVMETANDNRGFSAFAGNQTLIAVHRDPTAPCYTGPTVGKDFEMPNPFIPDPLLAGDVARSAGQARVVADKTGDQFIVADLRFGAGVAGIGLRRIAASNLISTSLCPPGTISVGLAPACTGANAVIVSATDDESVDFPGLAQDRRATGTGAGNIYVTNTAFDFVTFSTEIHLTACTRTFVTLAQCSPTATISSSTDFDAQFSSVSVVPSGNASGTITVVYIAGTTLKFVKCTPKGAPLAPACSAPTTIMTDPNVLNSFSGLMGNSGLNVRTIPVHIDRGDSITGQTTFVAWARCKVSTFGACPDADVVMTTSATLGASWSAMAALDATPGTHEFDPAIALDDGQNITKVAYYHTPDSLHFKNRTVVDLKEILSGSVIPGAVVPITTAPDSPEGDANFFFGAAGLGDYLGIAAHGTGGAGNSVSYIGHTNNARLGTYNGVPNAESNNHVSKAIY